MILQKTISVLLPNIVICEFWVSLLSCNSRFQLPPNRHWARILCDTKAYNLSITLHDRPSTTCQNITILTLSNQFPETPNQSSSAPPPLLLPPSLPASNNIIIMYPPPPTIQTIVVTPTTHHGSMCQSLEEEEVEEVEGGGGVGCVVNQWINSKQ